MSQKFPILFIKSNSTSAAPVNTCYDSRAWKILDRPLLTLCPIHISALLLRTRAVFDRYPLLFLRVVAGCCGRMRACHCWTRRILDQQNTVSVDESSLFVKIATVVPVTNNTLVFLAVTWRLHHNSYSRPTLRNSLQVLIFGDYLQRFSGAMLQDGQS